jgi:streptogramin lyase
MYSQVWKTYNVPGLNKVAIDRQDNKWFATENGVLKFDNTNWVKYDTTIGLASNDAYSVLIDHLGNKWFGSFNYYNDSVGFVTMFDNVNWTKYNVIDSPSGYGYSAINDIAEDSVGNIWFATSSGVSMFNRTIWKYYHVKDGLPSNFIRCIVTDKFGNKWFGTQNGLSKFNGTTWITYNTPDSISGPTGNCLLSLAFDKQNNLWIGGSYGFYKLQNSHIINANPSISDVSSALVCDKTGDMWIGYKDGFIIYDGSWHYGTCYAGGILSMAVDTDNSIWLGANNYNRDIPLVFNISSTELKLDTITGSKNYFVINSNTSWILDIDYNCGCLCKKSSVNINKYSGFYTDTTYCDDDCPCNNWANVSNYSGYGSDTIWVSVSKDYNGYLRSATINVSDFGLNVTKSVTISQGVFTNVITEDNPILNIYPNPVIDNLVVENANQNQISKLEIYSVNGVLMAVSMNEANKYILNMKNYKEGVYFLKAFGKNSIITKKIIKINK